MNRRTPERELLSRWQRLVDSLVNFYARIRFRQRLFNALGELLKQIPERSRELAKRVYPPPSGYTPPRSGKGSGRAGLAHSAASGSSSAPAPVDVDVDVGRRHNKIHISINNNTNVSVPREEVVGKSRGRRVSFEEAEDLDLWPEIPPPPPPPEWRPPWHPRPPDRPPPDDPEAQAEFVRRQAWRVHPSYTTWAQEGVSIPRWDPADCDWGDEQSC